MGRKEDSDRGMRRSECHDNGELFWIEGADAVLPRPSNLSSEQWANLSVEWKAALRSLCVEVLDGFLEDATCAYCGESILPHEPRVEVEGPPIHHECGFRMVYGSVGHQRGQCPCHGQDDLSELGMTLQEGARASLGYFLAHRRGN